MPLITISRSDGDYSKAPEGFAEHELDIRKNPNYYEHLHEYATRLDHWPGRQS